jgi:hypothetical protein
MTDENDCVNLSMKGVVQSNVYDNIEIKRKACPFE